ncbi:MAG: hypothetical protein K0M45_07725 [Candidatus Paracaedibacteraceae bacterium]|nr:hypothetical protein [Candidatus Paracaedibacteraceae bacterium]
MHESTFFDASFVVFIGFVMFMGIALKFGYHKAVGTLDREIKAIKTTLDQATAAFKAAEEQLSQERRAERHLSSEIDNLKILAEKRIEELQQLTHAEINAILTAKQHTADLTLDMMRHATILALREKLADQAKEALTHIIMTSTDQQTHEILNDQALEKLHNLLTASESNDNGRSPRQAIV